MKFKVGDKVNWGDIVSDHGKVIEVHSSGALTIKWIGIVGSPITYTPGQVRVYVTLKHKINGLQHIKRRHNL